MKSWLLVFLLGAPLVGSSAARADDLSARAAQVKAQLQTTWLPTWAVKSPANEDASDAAQLVETLSHAHRLGYSTPQLDLLGAARVHYRLLRDSRRDKTSGAFFSMPPIQGRVPLPRLTSLQARVVLALVEYARASGESEPRALAIKTWRLVRDRAGDTINGGYYNSFVSGPLGPTQASGSGMKSGSTHEDLLEAGTQLFLLTRDRSIRKDVEDLLDLNEGRFFPTRAGEGFSSFTPDWKKPPDSPQSLSPYPAPWPSEAVQAATIIARAQDALGLPVGWVDFSRRVSLLEEPSAAAPFYAGSTLDALSLLVRNIPTSRERRATQIDQVLDTLNGQTPDVHASRALLDFVAAFDTPTR